jgi:hypothetical protein
MLLIQSPRNHFIAPASMTIFNLILSPAAGRGEAPPEPGAFRLPRQQRHPKKFSLALLIIHAGNKIGLEQSPIQPLWLLAGTLVSNATSVEKSPVLSHGQAQRARKEEAHSTR